MFVVIAGLKNVFECVLNVSHLLLCSRVVRKLDTFDSPVQFLYTVTLLVNPQLILAFIFC